MKTLITIVTSFILFGCQSNSKNESDQMVHKPNIQPHKSQIRQKFGDTCYTLIREEYEKAEILKAKKEELNKQFTGELSAKNGKILNEVKEIDLQLLHVGEPESFAKQCYFAGDYMASRDMRNNGQYWCAIGLEIIPIFSDHIDQKTIDTINQRLLEDENFKMNVNIKKQSMCKI